MSSKEKTNTKRYLEIESPEPIPKLTKQSLNIDEFVSADPFAQKLGTYSIILDNIKQKSIYKKLLSDGKNKENQNNISPQYMREIRNKYLKRLVESNPSYFPKELGLDEYKMSRGAKEEKKKNFIKFYKELAKKLKEQKEKGNNESNSRKNSTNLQLSRKESLLENKRKRTNSMNDENDNKKDKEDEENGEEYNNFDENEEHNGEASYEEDDYPRGDDDDSQNYNYSDGYGDYDDGGDY